MNRFCIIFLLFCFISCSNSEKVRDFDDLFVETKDVLACDYLKDSLMLGRPFFMQYSDHNIVIYDDLGDSIFTMIDTSSKDVYRFGIRGEGVDEFLQVASLHKLNVDSVIGVYDFFKHTISSINLNDVKKKIYHFPIIARDSLNSIDLCPTKYDTFIGLGFYENNMLALLKDGVTERFFFEYPYRDDDEKKIKNRLRGMAYQGILRSNKSLDKCIYAIRCAPIFFLYSISENEILETYKWIGGYPKYVTKETETMRSAPMSLDNQIAFISAYATDKYVYLLYSGKTIRDNQGKAFTGDVIYQITWDAKPVCKFRVNVPIMLFCVSDFDDKIYAIADKLEPTLVEIPLNTDKFSKY